MAEEKKVVDQDPDLVGVSLKDVLDFISNPVWLAMKEILERRLESTRDMLEMSPVEDLWGTQTIETKDGRQVSLPVLDRAGVRRLQGEATTIHLVLALPQDFKQSLEGEQNGTTE